MLSLPLVLAGLGAGLAAVLAAATVALRRAGQRRDAGATDAARIERELGRIISQGHGPMLRRLVYYKFDLDAIDVDTVAQLQASRLLPLSREAKRLLADHFSSR